MGEPRHWHIVMYDVSDSKILRRTHKLLRSWGRPLQYSVFRVRCTSRGLERLRCELEDLLEAHDRLLIARLCDGCAGRVIMRGRDVITFDDEPPPFTAL
jgi:CRISPR-associated protein Cas2